MTRSYGKIASARSVLTTGEERDNLRDVQPGAVGGGEHCLVISEAVAARSSVTSPTLSTTGIRRGYGRTMSRRPKSGWSSSHREEETHGRDRAVECSAAACSRCDRVCVRQRDPQFLYVRGADQG